MRMRLLTSLSLVFGALSLVPAQADARTYLETTEELCSQEIITVRAEAEALISILENQPTLDLSKRDTHPDSYIAYQKNNAFTVTYEVHRKLIAAYMRLLQNPTESLETTRSATVAWTDLVKCLEPSKQDKEALEDFFFWVYDNLPELSDPNVERDNFVAFLLTEALRPVELYECSKWTEYTQATLNLNPMTYHGFTDSSSAKELIETQLSCSQDLGYRERE